MAEETIGDWAASRPWYSRSEEGRPQITINRDPSLKEDPLNAVGNTPQGDETIGAWAAQQPKANALPTPMSGPEHDAAATNGGLGRVLDVFGQGYATQWGAPNFGKELSELLKKHDLSGDPDIGKAFNEAFVRPAAQVLDLALRGLKGTFSAVHDASVTAADEYGAPFGVPAAMMEAFPNVGFVTGLRYPRYPGGKPSLDLRVAQDIGIIGEELKPMGELPIAEAVTNGVRPITAYHGSPHSFEAFSVEKIGTGEGAQTYGHGLYFAEHPEVAAGYASRLSGGNPIRKAAEQAVKKAGSAEAALAEIEPRLARMKAGAQLDPTNIKFLEDVSAEIKATRGAPGANYQVRLHVNKDHMLDWDAPASQQPPGLKAAYKKAGLDLSGATDGADAYHQLVTKLGSKEAATQALHEAGIPGIKYLDQGSRASDAARLESSIAETTGKITKIQKELADNKDNPGLLPAFFERKNADIASLEKDLERYQGMRKDLADPTRNIVIFSDKDVEVTHVNGAEVSRPVPATVNPNNLTQPGAYPWFENAQKYLGKLDAPEGVVNLLQSALAKSDFTQARQGNVPLAHYPALSEASGIPTKALKDGKGAATDLMKHDDAVRAATAMMLKAADDVTAAARSLKLRNGVDDAGELAALGEAIMRRKLIVDTSLEQIMGLRAEFGRTGNALQEFLKAKAGTENLSGLLKDTMGKGADDLRAIADGLDKLPTRASQARFLRDAARPNFVEKLQWYWVNALLSGPMTHIKYGLGMNAAYAAYETLVVTPIAGVSGTVRQALSKEQIDHAYMGEFAAKAYGLIAGVPDALRAAGETFRTGVPTALAAQVRGADYKNPVTGIAPIEGKIGTAIGVPSRVSTTIHSFYNFLGYRAEIEAVAYRRAAKDGYKPTERDFWKAQKDHAQFPDDAAMDAGILAGERLNFTQEMGPQGERLRRYLNDTVLGKFIVPFMRVPANAINIAQEGTPLAFLDKRMRADLLGKNGGVARDMANARLVAGSAIVSWAAFKVAGDDLTGHGPVDPKDRAEWLRTHQPYSVKVGGNWISYANFAPLSIWFGAAANVTDIKRDVEAWKALPGTSTNDKKRADDQLQEVYSRIVFGITDVIKEAGYQSAFDLVMAMNDPEKSKAANFGRTIGTFMPYSSALSQTANFMDPNMRELNTLMDGVRNMIPGVREALPVAVDWLGETRPNPGYHSIVRSTPVGFSYIDLEMQRLDLKPAVPENNLRGARMTPEQYHEFKVYAGVNTKTMLEHFMSKPNWPLLPDYGKKVLVDKVREAARKQAEAAMFAKYHNLISDGAKEKVDGILGVRPKPPTYQRP